MLPILSEWQERLVMVLQNREALTEGNEGQKTRLCYTPESMALFRGLHFFEFGFDRRDERSRGIDLRL